jgi:hypothetical protein
VAGGHSSRAVSYLASLLALPNICAFGLRSPERALSGLIRADAARVA